ncbi:MAG TPA: substrate-binding domain-containing protein, partial [Solirubrobacterales bacterium]|nr:substrate-binding domain-containing protein [Solirubrobacterales bacterium]
SGTVALLLPNEEASAYTNMTRDRPEFEREVADLCSGCKVIYRNAKGSAALQQEQAEEAMAKGAKVLVVAPVSIEKASDIVQTAKLRHVPVISYGRLIYNARVDYYVDAEDADIGKDQATVLAEELKGMGKPHGPLAVVTVSTSGPVNGGAREVFSAEEMEVADEHNMSYLLQEAPVGKSEREMKRVLKAIGPHGFNAVYAFDDKAAEGTINVMKAAGIDPAEKPTTGAGATIPALQRILAGEQAMTVYEADQEVTDTAAELAVELAEGKEPPPSKFPDEAANGLRDVPAILLKSTAVTKDDMKKTVIDNGFVDPSQLCTGRYAKYCREAGITAE